MLANDYRPSLFKDVIGQDSITSTIMKSILQLKVPSAFLFAGPSGTGKTTVARILAKAINCEDLQEGEPCNKCDICKSISNGTSFNVTEIDAASNNSVDDIRALVDQIRYSPQIGKYRIIILDEVHRLSVAAFNSLLKTLEEPPAHVKFVLCTTEMHQVIDTIVSRCQIHKFRRVTNKEITTRLATITKAEGIEIDTNSLQLIAEISKGSVRDAISSLQKLNAYSGERIDYGQVLSILNIFDKNDHFRMMKAIKTNDVNEIIMIIKGVHETGYDYLQYLTSLVSHCRNLLICTGSKPMLSLLEVDDSVRMQYEQTGKLYNEKELLLIITKLQECMFQFDRAVNQRLHVEIALLGLLKSV